MERYTNHVIDLQGNRIGNMKITAWLPFTGDNALPADKVRMYAQNGQVEINEVFSDGLGRFDFYCKNQRIDIRLEKGGEHIVLEDQLCDDPVEDANLGGVRVDVTYDTQDTEKVVTVVEDGVEFNYIYPNPDNDCPRYLLIAKQGTSLTDEVWTVIRATWRIDGYPLRRDKLVCVAADDPDSLPWPI